MRARQNWPFTEGCGLKLCRYQPEEGARSGSFAHWSHDQSSILGPRELVEIEADIGRYSSSLVSTATRSRPFASSTASASRSLNIALLH